jgi:hypothetical protein
VETIGELTESCSNLYPSCSEVVGVFFSEKFVDTDGDRV